jgi:hypothetical protein
MEDELGVGPLLLTYISTALFTLLLPSGMQQWREAASRDAEAVQPLVPIIKLAAKFAGLWFLANAFFNLGLKCPLTAPLPVLLLLSFLRSLQLRPSRAAAVSLRVLLLRPSRGGGSAATVSFTCAAAVSLPPLPRPLISTTPPPAPPAHNAAVFSSSTQRCPC